MPIRTIANAYRFARQAVARGIPVVRYSSGNIRGSVLQEIQQTVPDMVWCYSPGSAATRDAENPSHMHGAQFEYCSRPDAVAACFIDVACPGILGTTSVTDIRHRSARACGTLQPAISDPTIRISI
jgi:hypothetical protein